MIESLMQPSADGSWQVPSGWGQGRAVYGGLLMGALINAARGLVTEPGWPLRTLTATFVGAPVVGPALVRTQTWRTGGGSSVIEARLNQGADIKVQAVLLFGKPRAADVGFQAMKVAVPADWQQAEVVEVGPPLAPEFAQAFEYRPTGPWPFAGGELPHASGWVRPRQFSGRYDAALVAACADAYWHSLHARSQAPRPSVTFSFSLELFGGLEALEPHAPLFHHATTLAAHQGYASEVRTLWSAGGALLAVNHQAIAVLR